MITTDFNVARAQDAWATIRGFVYQVQRTILVALALGPQDRLELECGEDLDHVLSWVPGDGVAYVARVLEQVKHRNRSITLESLEAKSAILNFVEHLLANAGGARIRFRYVTNAVAGKEKRSPTCLGGRKGIDVWRGTAEGTRDDDGRVATRCLFEVIASWHKPKAISSKRWKKLHGALISDTNLWISVVERFEWGVGFLEHEEVESAIVKELRSRGLVNSDGAARVAHQRLFLHVFRILAQEGPKALRLGDVHEVLQRKESDLDAEIRGLLQSELLALTASFEEMRERLSRVEVKAEMALAAVRQLTGGSSLTVARGRPRIQVDPPPAAPFLVERSETIDGLLKVPGTRWIAIRGVSGMGKTQLARQAALSLGEAVWLRMRGLQPPEVLDHIAAALEYLHNPGSLGAPISVLVLDDLPDLGLHEEAADLLNHELGNVDGTLTVISTSNFSLPSRLRLADYVAEHDMPVLSLSEVRVLLAKHGAPETSSANLAKLVLTFSAGHGVFASALCVFMRARGWEMDAKVLESLLGGAHLALLEEEVGKRISTTVQSDDSRRLLYRLRLAIAPITKELVNRLGEIDPPVNLPGERLLDLSGPWVQREGQGEYSVSPLVKALPKDTLPREETEQCHAVCADVLLSGAVDQWKLMTIIVHLTAADLLERAATTLLGALHQLAGHKRHVPDGGLLSIWWKMPLPERFPNGLRIQVRAAQIAAGVNYEKAVDHLEVELHELLRGATTEDDWSIVAAAILAFHLVFPRRPRIASSLMRSAIQVYRRARLPTGELAAEYFPYPLDVLFYIVTGGVSDRLHVECWLECVAAVRDWEALDWSQIEEGGAIICTNIFLAELKRGESQRSWSDALRLLGTIEGFASGAGLEHLRASCESISLSIRGEYLGERREAIEHATGVIRQFGSGGARLVVIESLARQLLIDGDMEAARRFLTEGFEGLGSSRVEAATAASARIMAARAFMGVSREKSVGHAKEAVRCAVDGGFTAVQLARFYGDACIAAARAEDFGLAFEFCEAGLVGLWSREERDSPKWNALFLGFADAASRLNNVLVRRRPEAGFADLSPGRFLDLTDEKSMVVSSAVMAGAVIGMSLVARALGRLAGEEMWALKAWDVARESAEVERFLVMFPSMAGRGDLEPMFRDLLAITEKILSQSPEGQPQAAAERAMLFIWTPLVWRLVVDKDARSVERYSFLAAVAESLQGRPGGEYWTAAIAGLRLHGSSAGTGAFIDFANKQAAAGRRALSGLSCVLSLQQTDVTPSHAVVAQMLGLARSPGVLLSGPMVRRVISYLIDYWGRRVREEGERFSNPVSLQAELHGSGEGGGGRVLGILTAVAQSLGARLPPEFLNLREVADTVPASGSSPGTN